MTVLIIAIGIKNKTTLFHSTRNCLFKIIIKHYCNKVYIPLSVVDT